jgi:membrane protein YqaA with SNARE-associated domain
MKYSVILEMLTVAGLASFEIYAAIPTGFAFELSPWNIFFASVAGGLAGVFVTAYLGDKIRKLFTRGKAPKEKKSKPSLAHRIWLKYGIIGLGLVGTMTVGAPACIAVGIGFNAPLRKLLTWCCIGVIARCALFTTIGYYGVKLVT